MRSLTQLPTLLVAMPNLMDPNFQHAVILLMEHSEKGAMGFIINRMSSTPIKSVLSGNKFEDIPGSIKAWYGGPVDSETGLILKPDSHLTESNICLSSSEDSLKQMIDSINQKDCQSPWLYPYRFLIGYAGWAPNQLDQELRLGTWMEVPYTNNLLFNCERESIWERALTAHGAHPNSLIGISQPYLN